MYDPGTLYSDPILTNFSVGYKDQALYADRIMPETPVLTQSGRYRVFDRSNWLIFESAREPGAVANEVLGRKWSEDTFATRERSLQAPILDEERMQLQVAILTRWLFPLLESSTSRTIHVSLIVSRTLL